MPFKNVLGSNVIKIGYFYHVEEKNVFNWYLTVDHSIASEKETATHAETRANCGMPIICLYYIGAKKLELFTNCDTGRIERCAPILHESAAF